VGGLSWPRVLPQSQRDCAPRVARNELPWVNVTNCFQPQRGCASSTDHLFPNNLFVFAYAITVMGESSGIDATALRLVIILIA
jgi:hypothetical protein